MAAGAVAVGTGVAAAVLYHVNAAAGHPIEPSFWLLATLIAVGYGGTGLLLARRGRVPVIRDVFLAIGLVQGVAGVAREYGVLALTGGPGLPAGEAALWLGSWLWAPSYVAIPALLPLLLPEGRLPSPRWRPALGLSLVAVAATAALWALTPYPLQDVPIDVGGARNPVGVAAAASAPALAAVIGATLLAVGLALASAVVRWRRARGAERQQLKWLLLGVLATVALLAVALASPQPVGELVAGLAMLPLPVAWAVAALRHRLWDVDVVLSRSLLFGTLSALVVAGYVAAVGLLGGVLGAGTGTPILATTAVALLVLPLHGRLQRLVNRLVHGEPEDPYTALARIGERLAASAEPAEVADRVLPEVVAQVARLLRVPYAAIDLAGDATIACGEPPGDVLRVPLEYGGAEVGALLVAAREPGPSRDERALLDRLARQAAVAVHAVLLARDVQRSRRLVVTAREEERRRLRRDLHDGLGPLLAALALQAETARDLVPRDPAAATALLDRLVPRLGGAVAEVRTLVHDLRPPTLDELGLAGALRELAARFATPDRLVHTDLGDPGPLPAAVDVAAYRIASEALANAARHADATAVSVAMRRDRDTLRLTVTDDGRGLPAAAAPGVGLTSMRERAEQLGGRCTAAPGPDGRGTRVCATIPLEVP